jgi:hypothetical protein
MAVFELFSQRQKKLRGEVPEIYTYDEISNKIRVQIIHIIKDSIGEDKSNYSNKNAEEIYKIIHEILCREYGVFELGKGYNETDETQVLDYLLQTKSNDEVLDIIELSFKCIEKIVNENEYYTDATKVNISPSEAIEELNHRFKEHGIGYQFDGGEIIKVDSTFIHSEITRPTINLLWNETFLGANEEYMKAHEHYRHGRNKECLSECLKAFESTIKIICKEKGWAFNQNDPAKKLIQVCFQNNLVPVFTQNQFTSLQNLLESGIPTIRNKLGGHGQGQNLQKVDDEMTRYGLNLTGSNIIFLIEQSGIK